MRITLLIAAGLDTLLCNTRGFQEFQWQNSDAQGNEYRLTSVAEQHDRQRALNRKKVGTRAPIHAMAEKYPRLLHHLGSAGKKNKGRQVLHLDHMTIPENQWNSHERGSDFKPFLFELAQYLREYHWETLELEVSTDNQVIPT